MPPMGKQLGRDYDHGYAVVRIDDYQDDDRISLANAPNRVMVTKVVESIEEADAEVARLSEIADRKGQRETTTYFWQTTRLMKNQ